MLYKVNISVRSVTRLPLLSCTSWRFWKQAQIEISLLDQSTDLNFLLEPKQTIFIQAQMKTFQWVFWETKTISKSFGLNNRFCFQFARFLWLVLIHLEELYNNSLRNAMEESRKLFWTSPFFQILGIFTLSCLCNSAKHHEAARASIFSRILLFEWKVLLGASTCYFILSKCHQARLAPETNFAKSWVLAGLVS